MKLMLTTVVSKFLLLSNICFSDTSLCINKNQNCDIKHTYIRKFELNVTLPSSTVKTILLQNGKVLTSEKKVRVGSMQNSTKWRQHFKNFTPNQPFCMLEIGSKQREARKIELNYIYPRVSIYDYQPGKYSKTYEDFPKSYIRINNLHCVIEESKAFGLNGLVFHQYRDSYNEGTKPKSWYNSNRRSDFLDIVESASGERKVYTVGTSTYGTFRKETMPSSYEDRSCENIRKDVQAFNFKFNNVLLKEIRQMLPADTKIQISNRESGVDSPIEYKYI